MKLSDYLVKYLVDSGITHVFLVIGGACAHIVDSLGANKDISYVCMQHEQAAAMAADAYARLTGMGAAVVTSGPGATNLITGIACSWFDSIPVILISGQVNLWETKGDKKIRQLGFQETEITEIVKPITKFAVMVTKPEKIKYYLDYAFYLAREGRPGPVWLDIPLNVQHAEINPKKLEGFTHKNQKKNLTLLKKQVQQCLEWMKVTFRPIILAGFGIRVGEVIPEFRRFVEFLGFPVVSTWSAADILPQNHPQYIGRIGVYGARAANFTIQNSDLLISIGSRLDTRQTGGQPQTFARAAKKIVVDIDKTELQKDWVKPDLAVNFDAKVFLKEMNEELMHFDKPKIDNWFKRCQEWKRKYPPVQLEYYRQKDSVNPYVFIEKLSKELSKDAVIVCDIGAHTAWTMQAFGFKDGQRLISALGCGPMGYGLPAAIGASFSGRRPVICIAGDGGMQVNIQELQTVVNNNLPIKIFIFNNKSYGIIKQFQDSYFNSKYFGSEIGYSAPNFTKIGAAFGLKTYLIKNNENLEKEIEKILKDKSSVLCELQIDKNQKIIPKLEAVKISNGRYISNPIENQWPYLPRSEFLKNMIIKPLKEKTGENQSSKIN